MRAHTIFSVMLLKRNYYSSMALDSMCLQGIWCAWLRHVWRWDNGGIHVQADRAYAAT